MNTYDPEQLFEKPKKKKKHKWVKGLVIFLAILAGILALGIFATAGLGALIGGDSNDESNYQYSDDYIGVLEVHGTMYDDGSDPEYDQQWLLERIDQMKADNYNRGMMLSIDTPGGSVYAIDELYLKIKEYQDATGRPVYAYMESMAASGGYYISAPADKIIANRNCWTGSIGVTVGTIYDISEFLEELGVKTVTITAGENKAMGSIVDPLTEEQKEIYQSLVDEAYEQFVEIVAEGRHMDLKAVKKVADGRIYTAKQALELGLIDGIATREDAIAQMKKDEKLNKCEAEIITYEPEFTLSSWLYGMAETFAGGPKGEYEQLMELMGENQKFTISYMSQERK